MTDHDLLIQLNEQVGNLCTHLKNHLAHHWAASLSLLMIIAGLVAAILIK